MFNIVSWPMAFTLLSTLVRLLEDRTVFSQSKSIALRDNTSLADAAASPRGT